MGENLTLCLAQRRSMEESQLLGWELEQLSKTTESSPGKSRGSVEKGGERLAASSILTPFGPRRRVFVQKAPRL